MGCEGSKAATPDVPPPFDYEVTFEKQAGQTLGLSLDWSNKMSFCITDVKAVGLVQDLNESSAKDKVKRGDIIVNVNGVCRSFVMMTEQLKQPKVTLQIERGTAQEMAYIVDDSMLNAYTPGLAFRRSKNLDDRADDRDFAIWGGQICGLDDGEGWVKLRDEELFLPMHIGDAQVLKPVLKTDLKGVFDYEVAFEKQAGQSLGIEIDWPDMVNLYVKSVKAAGLVQDYNKTDTEDKVKQGDIIVSVNGVHRGLTAMIQELNKAKVVLQIRRTTKQTI